jgi:hypothetical protein
MTKDQKNKTIIIFVYSILTFLFVGVFTYSKLFGAQESFSFDQVSFNGCPRVHVFCPMLYALGYQDEPDNG